MSSLNLWPKRDLIARIAFVVSVICGFLIWWLAPNFIGEVEPWDSESSYFGLALIAGGFIAGCIGGQPFWRWPIGIYLGQVLAMLASSFTEPAIGVSLMPLGVIFLIGYTVPSLLGSAAGAWLNQKLRHS